MTTERTALEMLKVIVGNAGPLTNSGPPYFLIPASDIEAARTLIETADAREEWRPIETAPRDGTPILLFTTCHGAVEAWFKSGEWREYPEGREYDGPVWVCADDAFAIEVEETPHDFHHGTATHWQPLPAPPKQSVAEHDWQDFPPGGPAHPGDDTRDDEFQFPPRKCSRPECNGTLAHQAALRCERWLDGTCELVAGSAA